MARKIRAITLDVFCWHSRGFHNSRSGAATEVIHLVDESSEDETYKERDDHRHIVRDTGKLFLDAAVSGTVPHVVGSPYGRTIIMMAAYLSPKKAAGFRTSVVNIESG